MSLLDVESVCKYTDSLMVDEFRHVYESSGMAATYGKKKI